MYWNLAKLAKRYCTTRLTLTWDVLKFSKGVSHGALLKININMRCIEILFGEYGVLAGRDD